MKLEQMRERLGGQVSLRSLPQVRQVLQGLLALPEVGLAELAAVLRWDAPLGARVLRSINSSWYGLPQPVQSIDRAAAMIGLNDLRQLIAKAPVLPSSDLDLHPGYHSLELWRRDVLCARLCANLASKLGPLRSYEAEEIYAIGLLHDIGQHVLLESLGWPWVKVLLQARQERRDLCELEQMEFGFTHSDLGGMIAKRWLMSDTVVAAARFHHGEGRVAWIEPVVAAVHVADALARQVCSGENHAVEQISPEALRLLQLNSTSIQPWLDLAQAEAGKLPFGSN